MHSEGDYREVFATNRLWKSAFCFVEWTAGEILTVKGAMSSFKGLGCVSKSRSILEMKWHRQLVLTCRSTKYTRRGGNFRQSQGSVLSVHCSQRSGSMSSTLIAFSCFYVAHEFVSSVSYCSHYLPTCFSSYHRLACWKVWYFLKIKRDWRGFSWTKPEPETG